MAGSERCPGRSPRLDEMTELVGLTDSEALRLRAELARRSSV